MLEDIKSKIERNKETWLDCDSEQAGICAEEANVIDFNINNIKWNHV